MSLHHIELWVPDLAAAEPSWQPFQHWPAGRSWRDPATGAYIVLEQSPALTATRHDRLAPGLNHLAFTAGTTAQVDQLHHSAPDHGWTQLFPDQYPHAGGPTHYATYLETQDGYEVELVANSQNSQEQHQ
jgi:catechol 2,3-dioxygenase-like lactoylglutathione lyase family enzyme